MTDHENALPDGVERDDPIIDSEDDAGPFARTDEDLDFGRGRYEDDDEPAQVGDRTISPVGSKLASSKGAKLAGAAAMVLVAGAALAMTWKSDDRPKAADVDSGPARQMVAYEPTRGPAPDLPRLDDDAQTRAEAEAMLLSGQSGNLNPTDGREPEVDPRIKKLQDAQRAPIMVQTGGGLGGSVQGLLGGNGREGDGEGGRQGVVSSLLGEMGREPNELERLRQGSSIGQSRARMLPNRNYLITAGTQIPCILQTAMDTSTPGFVSCLISRDVYSDNGNVVLMERGTRVLGEYQGGLRRGQNRMFVVWNRAVTPKGVSVNLGSPAADTLGRAGMSGQVETFFWERFGGAILLSVVDDAVALAATSQADARNTVRVPSDAASVALQNSINIAPVLRKNQGEEVSIFAASDFDFSSVYALSLR